MLNNPLLFFGFPWLVIFGAASLLLLAAPLLRRVSGNVSAAIALLGVVGAFVLVCKVWLSGASDVLSMLIFDRLTLTGWLLILLASGLTILLSPSLLNVAGRVEYYILVLLSALGMAALVAGNNLLTIFLGLETMSVALYALAGFLRSRPEGNEAAMKYFLMGAFASAFIVMGIAFIFGATGTTDLSIITEDIPSVLADERRTHFLFGLAMLTVGFGFKIAAVPFHAWAPDVYVGAPTPVTTFMATAVKVAAVVAFVRLMLACGVVVEGLWSQVMWGLSALTFIVGNIAALLQKNMKRLLAYSSIAHVGYMLVAFPALGAHPSTFVRSILFYLSGYVFMTAGAFAVIVALERETQSTDINALEGLSKRHPWLAATLTLFLLSLTGFPPTIGFFAKYYLFLGAVQAGFVSLVVLALINSAISAYYYLRPVVAMYFHEGAHDSAHTIVAPAGVVAVIAITVLCVLYFGIFPTPLLHFFASAL